MDNSKGTPRKSGEVEKGICKSGEAQRSAPLRSEKEMLGLAAAPTKRESLKLTLVLRV